MRRLLILATTVGVVLLLASGCSSVPSPVVPSSQSPVATSIPPQAAAPSTAVPPAAAQLGVPTQKPQPTPVAINRGGTLVQVANFAWATLDPHLGQDLSWSSLPVMEYLVRHRYSERDKRFELEPGLALSWQNTDPKTFVLQLRKGVKFHDGSEFNAEVAKWNIDRMLGHPKSATKEFVDSISSVEVLAPDTIKLNLKSPAAPLMVNLSQEGNGKTAMISEAAATANGDDWVGRNPVGTGPFRFSEWKVDDRVNFKRNDSYWENGADGKPLPYLDGLVVRWIGEETVAVNELRTGNVHYVELTTATHLDTLNKNPDVTVSTDRAMRQPMMLASNMIKGPFKEDLNLRRAAYYAIDRDAMAKMLGGPGATPACYLVAEGQLGYDPGRVPCDTFDLSKAKQLLAAAGYPDGMDITLIGKSVAVERSMAEMLKNMLDKAGFRTSIDLMDRLPLVNRRATGENWALSQVGAKHTVDPDINLAFRLVSGGAGNYGGWNDTEFDKCANEGKSTYDGKQRHEIYVRCLKMVYEKAPVTGLWLRPERIAMSSKLQGMRPHWLLIDFWGEFWFRK